MAVTAEQLDLFADTQAEPEPLYCIARCLFCAGEPLDVISIENGRNGGRWYEASLWAYLAQLEHNRAVHPEKVPDYHRRDEEG